MIQTDNVDWEGTREFIKLPDPIKAIQIDEEFVVSTFSGTMKGNPGDYLILGNRGEIYPCSKAVFEKVYKELKPGEDLEKLVFDIEEKNDGR